MGCKHGIPVYSRCYKCLEGARQDGRNDMKAEILSKLKPVRSVTAQQVIKMIEGLK